MKFSSLNHFVLKAIDIVAENHLVLIMIRSETHQRAQQKERETQRMRDALGIDKDYTAGQAFDQKLQEQRREEKREKR